MFSFIFSLFPYFIFFWLHLYLSPLFFFIIFLLSLSHIFFKLHRHFSHFFSPSILFYFPFSSLLLWTFLVFCKLHFLSSHLHCLVSWSSVHHSFTFITHSSSFVLYLYLQILHNYPSFLSHHISFIIIVFVYTVHNIPHSTNTNFCYCSPFFPPYFTLFLPLCLLLLSHRNIFSRILLFLSVISFLVHLFPHFSFSFFFFLVLCMRSPSWCIFHTQLFFGLLYCHTFHIHTLPTSHILSHLLHTLHTIFFLPPLITF